VGAKNDKIGGVREIDEGIRGILEVIEGKGTKRSGRTRVRHRASASKVGGSKTNISPESPTRRSNELEREETPE